MYELLTFIDRRRFVASRENFRTDSQRPFPVIYCSRDLILFENAKQKTCVIIAFFFYAAVERCGTA